jgi:tetratricopeptide (TPR) repeat protein
MGDCRSAIGDYNRAIQVDPNYSQAYVRRGWAFLCLDELANAEADFDKALKLAPGDAYAQSGRAEVCQRQNKPVPEERSTGLSIDNLRRMVEQPSEATAKEDHP